MVGKGWNGLVWVNIWVGIGWYGPVWVIMGWYGLVWVSICYFLVSTNTQNVSQGNHFHSISYILL